MTDDRTPAEITAENCLGDMVKAVLDQVKSMQKPWQELSETEQGEYLYRIKQECHSVLTQVADHVATNGQTALKAKVESVTFKGGVKAALEIPNHQEAKHDLADAVGTDVIIVISDNGSLYSANEMADPAEPELDFDAEEDPVAEALDNLGIDEDELEDDDALPGVDDIDPDDISDEDALGSADDIEEEDVA